MRGGNNREKKGKERKGEDRKNRNVPLAAVLLAASCASKDIARPKHLRVEQVTARET